MFSGFLCTGSDDAQYGAGMRPDLDGTGFAANLKTHGP